VDSSLSFQGASMETLFLECSGVCPKGMVVPPFRLESGGYLCVHTFFAYSAPETRQLLKLLVGEIRLPGILVHGRIIRAGRPTVPLGPFALLRRGTASCWLARSAQIPVQSAARLLRHLEVDPCRLVTHLPGTCRTLLGLAKAWESGADVVIYSTAGLDPLGVDRVHHHVASRLDRTAAIHIQYPLVSGIPGCWPGGNCVAVESHK
jgi:hypothetical protein